MSTLVQDENANDFLCSRKDTSLQVAYDGGGTVAQNTNFTTTHMPVGGQGVTAGGGYYKILAYGGRVDISSIPSNAVITNVAIRYYIMVDTSTRNFTVEMYAYDHGASFSTTDWQSSTELGTLYSNSHLVASDSTSGMTTGWNDYVMQAAAVSEIQARVDAAETYFEYYVSSDDNRVSDPNLTGSTEAFVEIQDTGSNLTEFTITYNIPDVHSLFLGTVF